MEYVNFNCPDCSKTHTCSVCKRCNRNLSGTDTTTKDLTDTHSLGGSDTDTHILSGTDTTTKDLTDTHSLGGSDTDTHILSGTDTTTPVKDLWTGGNSGVYKMIKHKFYKIVQTSKHREDNIPWRAKLYTDGTYNMYGYMKGCVVVESKVARFVSPPILFMADCKLSDLILSLEYIGKKVMRDGRVSGMICRPWIEPEK